MPRYFHLVPLALLLAACPQSSPVVPVPDSGDASALGPSPPTMGTSACQSACATMQQQNCREGSDLYCPGTMAKVEGDRLIVPTMCPSGPGCTVTCSWCATAKTSAEVVAKCGSSCTAP